HRQHLGDLFHRLLRQPPARLPLRQVQERQHRARLPALRGFGDVVLRLFEIVRRELERRRLLERRAFDMEAHRSISPKTMSIEPTTATRSASMCPLHMNSVAWRNAKPGERILQRYGRLVPSATRKTPNSPWGASTAVY